MHNQPEAVKDYFIDRKQHLDILEKRIRDLKEGYRQNIAILGDEMVGKTSILFHFLKKFYDNQTLLLYLQLRPEKTVSFGRRFIAVLLYNFLANSQDNLKEDLDFLIQKASSYIPKTVEKIKTLLAELEKKRKDNLFSELLSLCEVFHQESNKFCVVIFDEFTHLESLGIKKLYAEWSKLLIMQKNTLYIITSSQKYKARNILAKDLSLLFGNFEILEVEPFDTKTTEAYLEYTIKDLTVNSALNNFLVHFTGGYPFYLKLITELMLKSPQTELLDILDELLFQQEGILNQRFTNYLKLFEGSPYYQDCLSILYLIARGQNRLKDIAHILHRPKKTLDQQINQLLEFDTLSRSGDFLKINDRVFSFWLTSVYQEKSNSLTFDAKNQKHLFRQKIEQKIQEFVLQSKKPVSERMIELLRLFEDDQIQLERKKVRLNHFREIKSLELNTRSIKDGLICRSTDSLWIIAFNYALLTEEDIAEFSKECKKYKHKLQKKILITFQDIDANSRLRALEEKITTWNINNVNQILDLFYKPRIIA